MSDHIITVPLTKGQQATIDAVDGDLTRWKWQASQSPSGYYAQRKMQFNGKNRTLWLHRIILERKLGRPLEKGELTDHENGNTLDNRRENLRVASYSQNHANRKRSSNNKSGYKGVSRHKASGKWRAKIMSRGKENSLGYFDTPEEAYAAYCDAAHKLNGEFARLDGYTPPADDEENTSGLEIETDEQSQENDLMQMDYTATQPVADQLKEIVDKHGQEAETPHTFALLHSFERAAWIPRLFELVMQNMSGPGRFTDSDTGLQYQPKGEESMCRAVDNLLTAYLAMLDSLEPDALFNSEEAAAYLGMEVAGLQWYMYQVDAPHRLVPDKKMQRALVFRKSTLDRFQAEQRLSGGHRGKTELK